MANRALDRIQPKRRACCEHGLARLLLSSEDGQGVASSRYGDVEVVLDHGANQGARSV